MKRELIHKNFCKNGYAVAICCCTPSLRLVFVSFVSFDFSLWFSLANRYPSDKKTVQNLPKKDKKVSETRWEKANGGAFHLFFDFSF
jgi:hypothetical protein